MGKRSLCSPYKSNKHPSSHSSSSSHSTHSTKQKVIYIRTLENKGDKVIIASNFHRSSTLLDAAKTLDIPDIIDEETIFCTQEDFNNFIEKSSETLLNQLKSGSCFIPCYRFKLFKDKSILVPKSFKGKDLCDLLKNKHEIDTHLIKQLRIDSKLVDMNKELYLQEFKNDSRLSLLETDEELETPETSEPPEINKETTIEFEFISLKGNKLIIKINSSMRISELCKRSELQQSLVSFLEETKIKTAKAKDFRLCYLNNRGGISPLLPSLSTEHVYSIEQPRIIFWRYEHCVSTFVQNLHNYMNNKDSISLQFIRDTLFLSPSVKDQVFEPIFALFNCQEIEIDETKLKELIRYLVEQARLFMNEHSFSQLSQNLSSFKTLSFVPNEDFIQ